MEGPDVAIEMTGQGDNGPEKEIEFDSSWPLFSMYQKMTGEEDNKIAERWQKDADGIIIFSGLFSAAVAALVAVTVLDLKPNSQDTSAFYLQKMYELQVLVYSNASRTSIPSTPAQPDPFSPPAYAIWVNLLWFSSLVISLTCAMLATLMQQWARRYLRITQQRPGCEPHQQARTRAFFAEGIRKCFQTVDFTMSLIHLSLFVFLAGLFVYLFHIIPTAYNFYFPFVWGPVVIYLLATVVPLFRCDMPYYTSLSLIFGWLQRADNLAHKTVLKQASNFDGQVLAWVFNATSEDSQLAQFVESFPGFLRSSTIHNPLDKLTILGKDKLSSALRHFLELTWSSNSISVSESDKRRRFVICVQVADVARLPGATLSILKNIFPWDRLMVLQSVEMGHYLRNRGITTHQNIGLCAQSIVAGIITNVQGNDDGWIALAADQLGKSEGIVRGYLEHGNESVLLANLIHITREIFHSSLGDDRDMADASSYVLSSLSNFDIRNTLPGLQHDFLTLWDEIDREAQNSSVPAKIRDSLRVLYNAFNSGTDDTSTTPASSTNLNSYNHPSDSAINENSHTHITTSLPVSHHDAGLATVTQSPADVATDDINDTSSMADPIPQSTLDDGAAPQCNEGMTVPTAMVPGSLSPPALMPAPTSALTGGLDSPPDSAEKGQSDALPHTLVPSSSSSTTAFPRAAVHVASSSHPNVTTTTTTEPLSGIVVTRRDDEAEDIRTPTRPSAKAQTRPLPVTTALQSENRGLSENSI